MISEQVDRNLKKKTPKNKTVLNLILSYAYKQSKSFELFFVDQ